MPPQSQKNKDFWAKYGCYCGRVTIKGICPRCKQPRIAWKNRPKGRQKIGKYSGFSKWYEGMKGKQKND